MDYNFPNMKDPKEELVELPEPTPIPTTKVEASKLSQLTTGLLLLNLKKEMEEPAYIPMGRITKNRRVIQRRNEYSTDLERVIFEAKLTTLLMSEVQASRAIAGKIFEPEEIIKYHNGVFLDQVHQIKDKLLRLIDRLLLVPENVPDSQKKDPDRIKLATFLSFHESELKEIGIYDLLEQWDKGSVAVVLRRRTQYHHFVSTLGLNEDFQKIKMSRQMLNPVSIGYLSEYGKKEMAKIQEESFTKWKQDTVKKQEDTMLEIENNIEGVAEKLIEHFKIPTTPKNRADITNNYMEFLSSADIKNEASLSKISPELKPLIDGCVEIAKKAADIKLKSVYLVGSVARNEFNPGSSDINLYFILDHEGTVAITKEKYPFINAVFISEKSFMSGEHKKVRFICWSDGVLLHGEEIKFDAKEFPKAGTLLTLLLNRGCLEKLEEIKKKVVSLSSPDGKTLRFYTLKAVKIILDFDFGVAMANRPFYTASRKAKIAYTKESWLGEKRTTMLEQIYEKGTIRQKDFPVLIDTFLERAKINYQKMLDIEKEVLKDVGK